MARETLCQTTERILIITRAHYRSVCTPTTRHSRTNDLRSAVVRISAFQRDPEFGIRIVKELRESNLQTPCKFGLA